MSKSGMNYAPAAIPAPVVKPGEFFFAAIGLDHGHIYGQCEGLIGAGGTLKWVFDSDEKKMDNFCKAFPFVKRARSEAEILEDKEIKLVTGAAITSERCALGLRVMEAGKDYFTDKAPLTTLEQLAMAKEAVVRTGKKYMVYYSERLHVETAIFAGSLLNRGRLVKYYRLLA